MSGRSSLCPRRVTLLVFGLCLLSYTPISAYPALIDQMKKAIVFLGRVDQTDKTPKVNIQATGCLLHIEGIFHLLTAKHVLFSGPIEDPKSRLDGENLGIFLNRHDGAVQYRQIQKANQDYGVEWIFHQNPRVDLAVIPIGLDRKIDDFKTIPESLFFGEKRLYELYDVFFLSYQPGIELGRNINPVVRKGTISRINSDGTILIDGTAFPGNSGSPVFLTPAPIRFDEEGNTVVNIGDDRIGGRLIGIIGSYLSYQEMAVSQQTRRPRVIFEENTGLSTIWPVKMINELLTSQPFKDQLAALKAR
jgi:Trypsin-like peptidase domain